MMCGHRAFLYLQWPMDFRSQDVHYSFWKNVAVGEMAYLFRQTLVHHRSKFYLVVDEDHVLNGHR